MREIPLTKGYVALVDDDDFERVGGLNWCASETQRRGLVYAVRWVRGGGNIGLHRDVLGLPRARSPVVDHINCDTLDCRRANLRVCSHIENSWNARARRPSGLKGISPLRKGGWGARIRFNHHQYWLGSFATETEAAIAYDNAARLYFGEFARLNFPSNP